MPLLPAHVSFRYRCNYRPHLAWLAGISLVLSSCHLPSSGDRAGTAVAAGSPRDPASPVFPDVVTLFNADAPQAIDALLKSRARGLPATSSTAFAQGVVVTPDGYILTVAHLFGSPPAPTPSLEVAPTSAPDSRFPARLVWAAQKADLAIAHAPGIAGFQPAKFFDPGQTSDVGSPVVVLDVRNPPSGRLRTRYASLLTTVETSRDEGVAFGYTFASRRGSSGCPVLTPDGSLIGLNTLSRTIADHRGRRRSSIAIRPSHKKIFKEIRSDRQRRSTRSAPRA